MTANDFYRILSLVKGMEWRLSPSAKRTFGIPSKTSFIMGERHQFRYSPASAVASAVRRKFVDISNPDINGILRLNRRTWDRIQDACYELPGYSPVVRHKLLIACRLRKKFPEPTTR